MEVLPDFSSSKMLIKSRIEGALREKKRRPSIYQYSLFFCMFLFTSICTALYLKNIMIGKTSDFSGNNMDYYTMENLLRAERLQNDTIIELPNSFSFISAGESTLISNINFAKGSYE